MRHIDDGMQDFGHKTEHSHCCIPPTANCLAAVKRPHSGGRHPLPAAVGLMGGSASERTAKVPISLLCCA